MKNKVIRSEWSGTTLVEILVVITISSLIFLALFDGMGLAKKIMTVLTDRLQSTNTLTDNYRRMDDMLRTCDSAQLRGETLIVYRSGKAYTALELRDSMIVQTYEEGRDTLFRSVERWSLISSGETCPLPDSLRIDLWMGKKSTKFLFCVGNDSAGRITEKIREQEKRYEYEE